MLELLQFLGQLLVQLVDDLQLEQRHGFAEDALQQFGTSWEDQNIAVSIGAEEMAGSCAMFPPSFLGIQSNEVIDELSSCVLPLFSV